ncbi:MAG: WYL domain-containing protein [Sedimentisphaerales bacterium]|nr:WYL domain-containing protein [Sedimentisphaerales bacterium]
MSRISRIITILTTFGTGEPFTLDRLTELFGLCRRTILRDINELVGLGVSCKYNYKTGEYSIESDFFMSPVNFDAREAFVLLLLLYNAKNLTGLPIGNSASIAALKVESNLPETTRRYCASVLKKMSFSVGPRALQECPREIFMGMQTALAEKRIVRINYCSPSDSMVTEFHPYHLRYGDFAWQALGNSSVHRGIRCFQLNYIRELTLLNGRFTDGDDLDCCDYIGKAWATQPDGEIYDIKLYFSPQIAPSVAYIRWHSTQNVTFNEDGSVLMEFYVDGLDEILRWILGYGDQVQVIAPQILRDKIVGIAQNTARLHRQPGEEYVRELVAQAISA